MSLSIYVEGYSGYRANERPLRFSVDPMLEEHRGVSGVYDIEAIEDRWYDPDAEYFRVRTTDGKRYILRYDERQNEWTLRSGFDGDELLARPGTELITVEPRSIRQAESQIAGCDSCRPHESEIPFAAILADVLAKHGAFDFVLTESHGAPTADQKYWERLSSSL